MNEDRERKIELRLHKEKLDFIILIKKDYNTRLASERLN